MAHVLVVEDEPITAADVEHRLTSLGHTVTWFDTGEDVVSHAKNASFDLVLMDIRLRGELSGVEAARQLRELRDVPVVFVTAFADRETVDQACSTEPYGYLVKPFSDRSLASAVQVALTRAKADRAHLERERWLTAAMRSTGEAVIAVDERAAVRFMNGDAEALLGMCADAALGQNVYELVRFGAQDAAAAAHPLDRALRAGQVTSATAYISPPGQPGLHAQCSAAPVRSIDGSKTGAVLVVRAQPTAAGVAVRPGGWDALGARLAHEINNPLTATMGGLSLAIHELDELLAVDAIDASSADGRARAAALKEVSELLRDAHVGASRIADAMRELTALSLGPSQRTPLQLAELVDTAIQMSGVAARAVQVRPKLGAAPLVRGSKLQLAAAIAECIRSTVTELERRGALLLCVDMELSTDPAGWAELCIVGRAAAAATEPESIAQDAFVGSLGSTVAQKVVADHDGELTSLLKVAEPTWKLRLPPLRKRAFSLVPPGPASSAAMRGNILVVDDEPTIRRVLQISLRAHHDLTAVATVQEALSLVTSGEHFDAIVCDLSMPGAGGRHLHQQLLHTAPQLAERMLFITGGALSEPDERFIESMSGRYLVKPFSPKELSALISARMRACSAAAVAQA